MCSYVTKGLLNIENANKIVLLRSMKIITSTVVQVLLSNSSKRLEGMFDGYALVS